MKNTESILNNIKDLKKSAKDDLKSLAKDIDSLENWRIDYLGRNGQLSSLMKILATIPNEDKKIIGPKINQLKVDLNELFSNRKDSLDSNFSSIDQLPTKTLVKNYENSSVATSEKIEIKPIDYYFSNSIARASKTMSDCKNKINNTKKNGTNN